MVLRQQALGALWETRSQFRTATQKRANTTQLVGIYADKQAMVDQACAEREHTFRVAFAIKIEIRHERDYSAIRVKTDAAILHFSARHVSPSAGRKLTMPLTAKRFLVLSHSRSFEVWPTWHLKLPTLATSSLDGQEASQ